VFASVTFPLDGVSLPIRIRQRESGDVIRSHSMTKKIKKLLCDKDIPLRLRELLPIFTADSGEILWCPSVAVADGYPPPRDTASLRLTVIIHDI
jgi:tRNA(Ile)-lysidine synthetase-like protein